MLSSFLAALKISSIIPKRFLLQTGAKQYGVHLGPGATPEEESDPRITSDSNFCYGQEDVLSKWARENHTFWTITRPGYILGAVEGAAINLIKQLGHLLAGPKGPKSRKHGKRFNQNTICLRILSRVWQTISRFWMAKYLRHGHGPSGMSSILDCKNSERYKMKIYAEFD